MKALSILQPWAFLIVSGQKDIENRTWGTQRRGRVLIHAGKGFDLEGYRALARTIPMPAIEAFPRGGIVGAATIVDCVSDHASAWFSGPYGFVLEAAEVLPFRPLRGELGFFDVPELEQ